jgi:hypothetical protein
MTGEMEEDTMVFTRNANSETSSSPKHQTNKCVTVENSIEKIMDLIGKFKEVDPLVQANWMMKLFNKQYNKSIIIHSQILHIETQWDRNLQFKNTHPNFTISIIQQIPSIY